MTTITLRVPDRILREWDAYCTTVDDLDDDVDEEFREQVANTPTEYTTRSQLIRDSVQLNLQSDDSSSQAAKVELDSLEDKLTTLNSTIQTMDTKLDSIKLQLQDQFEDVVPDELLNDVLQQLPQLDRFQHRSQVVDEISQHGKDALLSPDNPHVGENYDDKVGWLSNLKLKIEYEDDMIEQAVTQLQRDIDYVNEVEWEDGDKFYWKSEYI